MGKERGKGTKKGWKRVRSVGMEEGLKEAHAQREMKAKRDSELFFEDVRGTEEHLAKLTHRQRMAFEHRNRMERLVMNQSAQDELELKGDLKEMMNINESKGDVKVKKTKIPEKKGRRTNRQQQPYDIWEDEGGDGWVLFVSLHRSERRRRKIGDFVKKRKGQNVESKRRKRPVYVPSALPAVVPPQEGASYNPSLDTYLKMVEKMSNEEKAIESKERRMERRIGISEAEAAICQGIREHVDCFTDKFDAKEETIVEKDLNSATDVKEKALGKRSKSEKEKKRKKIRRAETKKAMTEKKMEGKKKQQLQNLKSLKREVNESLKKQEERISQRRRERLEKESTKRKRLGRGKFEPYEEPLLLMDELPTNLRQLIPQGNILQERMKSLQQRNILPIAGDRAAKLKARLKAKLVEKRTVKEVTKESRVI